MASFSVNCSFTFHNFAWSVMEKKAFHKPPQALARKRYVLFCRGGNQLSNQLERFEKKALKKWSTIESGKEFY